jgi:hypothetical protein
MRTLIQFLSTKTGRSAKCATAPSNGIRSCTLLSCLRIPSRPVEQERAPLRRAPPPHRYRMRVPRAPVPAAHGSR